MDCAKFHVCTVTTSFIKMIISKSYSEYLQKWLPLNSLEYLTEFFNSAPADNSVQSCTQKKKHGGKFKFKGLLNICLCARFTYHQNSVRVRTVLQLKWFSHKKCSALIWSSIWSSQMIHAQSEWFGVNRL